VIGAGSTIGGNVFLMHSVPPNSLVLYEAGDIKVMRKRERPKAGLGKENKSGGRST
jgi:serine O-acetyltransferase